MSDEIAVQKAIRAALAADTALVALIGSAAAIYDEVPAETAFPFVAIGDQTVTPSAAGTMGETTIETAVLAFTDPTQSGSTSNQGSVQAKLIAWRIRQAAAKSTSLANPDGWHITRNEFVRSVVAKINPTSTGVTVTIRTRIQPTEETLP